MLSRFILRLQAEDPIEAIKNSSAGKGAEPLIGSDLRMLLAVIIGLAAILFLLVYVVRRRQANGDQVVRRTRDSERPLADGRQGKHGKRRKRRSDHPDKLRRNPTLAETGGLPPPRPEEPDPPPDPTLPPSQSQPQKP
jgi:hypothetical protein